ncbi:MAG: hypothetical protein IT323_04700 [Anaerolineae bacterium]|nr:hypothetical protein [Anaerolineae bacterium]
MDIEAWLARLDPAQVSFSVLAAIGIGLFIWRKVWPWLTDEYWPSRMRRQDALDKARGETEKERNAVLVMMRDTLVELKVIAAQQMLMLQQQRADMEGVAKSLLDQQRAILSFVENLSVENLDHAPCP